MKKFWIIGSVFCVLIAGLAAFATTTLMLQNMPPVRMTKIAFSPQEVQSLVPHRALYKIEMVQKSSSAQVLNISGQMYYEWAPACDAWTTNHRFNLTYDYAENPQVNISSDFTTFESMDGETFSFNSRRHRNGQLFEELRGHASLRAGQAGQALYTLPQNQSFDLPAGTLFPTAQTLAVLKIARTGQKFFKATVFDGSDEDGPVEVNTFIGASVQAAAGVDASPSINAALLNSPARKVRLAFFPLKKDDPDSDYEMNLVLLDNGVISDMRVDYKEFSVTQKLVGLESVKGGDCAGKTP